MNNLNQEIAMIDKEAQGVKTGDYVRVKTTDYWFGGKVLKVTDVRDGGYISVLHAKIAWTLGPGDYELVDNPDEVEDKGDSSTGELFDPSHTTPACHAAYIADCDGEDAAQRYRNAIEQIPDDGKARLFTHGEKQFVCVRVAEELPCFYEIVKPPEQEKAPF